MLVAGFIAIFNLNGCWSYRNI